MKGKRTYITAGATFVLVAICMVVKAVTGDDLIPAETLDNLVKGLLAAALVFLRAGVGGDK